MKGRIQTSTGFLVLLGFLFYLDEGMGLLFPGLLACTVHELGHILAIHMLGGRVKGLKLTVVGAELILDSQRLLSYGRELVVALSGPVGSFLCAYVAARTGAYLLAGLSLGQGIFNLLPIPPLDGGRVLYAGLSAWGGRSAHQILSVVSAIVVGLLLGLGLILIQRYGNPTLAVTSLWLLAGVLGSRLKRSEYGDKI